VLHLPSYTSASLKSEIMGANLDTVKQAKAEGQDNLNADKMFGDLWWLQYCICRGVGVGAIGNPLFGSEERNLCLHGSCQFAQIGDPFCQTNAVECCLTSQCQFPKAEGSPTCVCFNKKLAGGSTDGWKNKIFEWEGKFDGQFWLYYFLCAGVGVHGLRANDRPLLALVQKQFCIKRQVQLVAPTGSDGNLCSGVGTNLCLWSQCQFPPNKEGSPFIACCGWKMKNKGGNGKPMSYGA
jgi:hypothetical protein